MWLLLSESSSGRAPWLDASPPGLSIQFFWGGGEEAGTFLNLILKTLALSKEPQWGQGRMGAQGRESRPPRNNRRLPEQASDPSLIMNGPGSKQLARCLPGGPARLDSELEPLSA